MIKAKKTFERLTFGKTNAEKSSNGNGSYLVVLSDYGLDDAIAACRIFENYTQFTKIDILAIGGNVPPDVSLKNIKTLSSSFELDNRVTLVDTSDVDQKYENLYDIHGEDGMGGILKPTSTSLRCIMFGEWLRDYSGCDILLSLGPMTITEIVLNKFEPKEFVFMAGTVNAEPNYNEYEFNEGVNPKSFVNCIKHPHKAVTLDIGNEKLNILNKRIKTGTVRYDLIAKYRELSIKRGEKNCYIWDDITALYIFKPYCFEEKTEIDKSGNKINCLIYKGEQI